MIGRWLRKRRYLFVVMHERGLVPRFWQGNRAREAALIEEAKTPIRQAAKLLESLANVLGVMPWDIHIERRPATGEAIFHVPRTVTTAAVCKAAFLITQHTHPAIACRIERDA